MIVLVSVFVVGFVAIYGWFDMMKQIKKMVDKVDM
jgi:hypothetical protein